MNIKPGGDFSLKKSLGKFWQVLSYSIVIAVLAAVIKYLSGLESLTPEQVIYVGLIIAVLTAIRNALKHWHDKKEDSNPMSE